VTRDTAPDSQIINAGNTRSEAFVSLRFGVYRALVIANRKPAINTANCSIMGNRLKRVPNHTLQIAIGKGYQTNAMPTIVYKAGNQWSFRVNKLSKERQKE